MGAFIEIILERCTSGLVAGSQDGEEHALGNTSQRTVAYALMRSPWIAWSCSFKGLMGLIHINELGSSASTTL